MGIIQCIIQTLPINSRPNRIPIPRQPVTPSTTLVLLLKRLLNRFRCLQSVSKSSQPTDGDNTYINESLQVLVQIRQIVLALLVLRNQGLLALQQFLPGLFKFLSFGMFVVDAGYHELMLARLVMFRMEVEELFHWDQRQREVFVARQKSAFTRAVSPQSVLVRFTGGDFPRQVPLFIVQVLELQMQAVDLLAILGRQLFRLAHSDDRIAILATELG